MVMRMSTWARLVAGVWLFSAGSALAQDVAEPSAAPLASPDPTTRIGTRAAIRESAGVAGAGQGRGIALSEDGRSRLHLRLDAGVGFDTNPYRIPFDSPEFVGDVVTRVRPGLEIIYPGSMIAFDAGLFVDYGVLPGAINPATRRLLLFQSGANAGLEVNRGGMFSFAVADTFAWNNTPGVVNVGSLFNRLSNQLNAGVGFRPGGGTLSFKLGYSFGYEQWFDSDFFGGAGSAGGLISAGALDTMRHIGTLRADWRFLPRTGAFLQLRGGVQSYPRDVANVNPEAFPIGVQVGLMGQFTPKLSGLVSIGYQNPLVLDEDNAGNQGIVTGGIIGAIGQAELRWLVGPTTQLAGGFQRRIAPTALYQYITDNRLYVSFDQALGAKFVFGLNTGFSLLEFGEEQAFGGQQLTDRTTGRLDGQLDARASLAYYLVDWFSLGLVNNLQWRVTNASTVGGDPTNLSYLTNETLVLASLHY